MGQYYYIVNKTKKEYLHPHIFGDGLKAFEIVANHHTCQALAYLLVKSDGDGGGDLLKSSLLGHWAFDEIVIIGDYDSSKLFEEAQNTYKDISFDVLEWLCIEGIITKELIERKIGHCDIRNICLDGKAISNEELERLYNRTYYEKILRKINYIKRLK